VAAGSIDIFLQTIAGAGGMSFSNNWDIEFRYPGATGSENGILNVLREYTTKGQKNEQIIRLLCDEAQLPNVSTATGQMNGRYLGSGSVNYAHTRVYSDFSLGWMCDADLTPLKFLTTWNDYIFGTGPEKMPNNKYELTKLKQNLTGRIKGKNRPVRVRYPDDYMLDLIITKTEISPNAPNGRPPIAYYIEQVYPYSIDAVPLQYGASQITKVTASFYYARHHTFFVDTKNEPTASVRNRETGSGRSNLSDAQEATGNLDITRPYLGTMDVNNNINMA
jgi:hypothetical protein